MISETLSHYRILEPLGAGGMGVVYLAEDTRLRRKVALKLLPEAFTRDPQRLRRFEQEARAASALNHPNILTIFEIGQAEGTHFIATEFIDGQTLRERLRGGAVPIPEALDLAAQITAALAAAHEAGIVHRDIKPENVMVRRDGIAKVLDFGLAKLTESPTSVESEAPTIAKVNTDPGTVLGTASYMSPEQARGQDVDARSDLFSLGVMLYEMIAGQAPFGGANVLEVVSEILKTEPAPLRQFIPDVPSELQRIVAKTLRKDREQRYQHAKDLLIDLKDLKQELELEARLKGAPSLGVPPSGGSAGALDLPPEGGTPNATPAARTTSSAEIILGEIKRHRTGVLIGMVVLLVAAGLLGYGIYRFAAPKGTVPRFQNVQLTRLTSLGNVINGACISPDGKLVTYIQREADQYTLQTKAIATGSVVQIVPPTDVELDDPTFSPDGNYVYYRSLEPHGALYQVPVLGGTPRRVLTGINSSITFSPNATQFAFARRSTDGKKSELVIVNADGNGERILAEREIHDAFIRLAWSPDGKIIATQFPSNDYRPFGITVDKGGAAPIVQSNLGMRFTPSMAWLKNGKGLLLTAIENNSENAQVWHLSYPGGVVRRVTSDLAAYAYLSLTADGSSLAVIRAEAYSTLWVAPFGGAGVARQITRGLSALDGVGGVRWAPDGKIVYNVFVDGYSQLFMIDADGNGIKRLIDRKEQYALPVISADGSYLFYISRRQGKVDLWRSDLDGRNPKQLMTGIGNRGFDLSPDGRFIVFDRRDSSGYVKLYKISIDGGSPVQLTDWPANTPVVSPDGKLIACISFDSKSGQSSMSILSSEGGAPIKTLNGNLDYNGIRMIRWASDGRSLIYVDSHNEHSNLWRQPLDGGPPQPVTNFRDVKPERIWNFDISRDGRKVVLARGDLRADVVLISEAK